MNARTGAAGLIVVFGILYAWRLHEPELSKIDECRSGVIVRDILEEGDWLLPRTPDGYLCEKPPAYYHQAAVASAVFGANEWTLRGVSVLMALATLAVTWFWASLYGSPRVAALAVIALGSNVVMTMWARTAMVDMTFTFFVTAGLASYFAGRLGRLTPPRAAILCGVSLGLAVLSKGPLGLLLPMAAIMGEVLWISRGRFWNLPIPWGPTALGAGLILGISLLWYLPGCLVGGMEFVNTCILDENFYMPLGLKHGIAGSHVKSPLFYPSRVLVGLIPIAAFLPETIRWLFRRDAGVARAHAAAWFGFAFLVLSISSAKRLHYLLPLQPAASLMIAVAVGRVLDEGPTPALRWGVRVCGAVVLLAGVGVIVLSFAGPGVLAKGRFMDDPDFFAGWEVPLALLGAMMVGLGTAQLVSSWRGAMAMVRGIALMGILSVALRSVLYDGMRTTQDTVRPFIALSRRLIPPGARVAVVGTPAGYGLQFYWPERLSGDVSTADFYFDSLPPPDQLPKGAEVLASQSFYHGRSTVALIRNPPRPK